ncbi:MAG: biotin synthase BioB [Lachnospiraceae bacterium]|nr:biotin synthase BioB [Lachnospiraceae bacterium]
MMSNAGLLADEIIDGRRLSGTDDLSILKEAPLWELCDGADRIRKHFIGDCIDLCSIISGRNGACSENCRFCAQSAHNHTGCDVYGLLDYDVIYALASSNEKAGVDRFAIVISGRGPSDEDFEKIISIYKRLREDIKINLCASLGFLTQEQFDRLYDAGVRSYHNNIETSPKYFEKICTTHTFEDKKANIRRAQKAGLNVCSGGIIGMGETMDDRIDMALTLSELGIRSIPVNTLIPIPGTPMEHLPTLENDEILRTIAIFKYINPEADIRLGAGRSLIRGNGEAAFMSGASATITGDMLTTSGSTIKSDIEMIMRIGRKNYGIID